MHELSINRFELFIVMLFNNVLCLAVTSRGENFDYDWYFLICSIYRE